MQSTSIFQNPWLLALRPKTLTAALVPIMAATSLARHNGFAAHLWIVLSALASSFFIQIATNLYNDAIDFRKGADLADRLGPARVTQAGLLSEKQVFWGAGFCLVMAALFGLYLVQQGGWPIFWIGLVSLVLAYSYTGGPFPLAYLGLGDVFVVLFFGIIAVTGMYYLLTFEWTLEAGLLGLQIGLLAAVLIAINNLRDWEGDVRANKKTIPVRLGVHFAKCEILGLLLLPFVLQVFWGLKSASVSYFWLPFLALPLAGYLAKKLWQEPPSRRYNRYLGLAALLHLLFGVLISLGWWLHD